MAPLDQPAIIRIEAWKPLYVGGALPNLVAMREQVGQLGALRQNESRQISIELQTP